VRDPTVFALVDVHVGHEVEGRETAVAHGVGEF
jgi:hypothetical protein